jgi:hypothetical protein
MAAFEIRKLQIFWKINLDLAFRIQNNFDYSRSQWPLAGCDCGLESRRGHGCLSVLSIVYGEVHVFASG